MNTTFIYCLNDPRDGRLRYVGKADVPYRRLKGHLDTSDSKDHRGAWIRSLLALGLKPELEILEEIPTEGWQEIEKEYIRVFRMVCPGLVNTSDGGDGTSGFKQSAETCAKVSANNRNRSAETRAKIGASKVGNTYNVGRTASLETRAKQRAAKIGKTLSSEHRAKLSAAMTGQKRSLEHCARMSALKKGKRCNISPEGRARRIRALTGRKHSAEHCAKIRAAMKGRIFSPETLLKMRFAAQNRKSKIT